jgi:hypothetical protein
VTVCEFAHQIVNDIQVTATTSPTLQPNKNVTTSRPLKSHISPILSACKISGKFFKIRKRPGKREGRV